MPDAYILTESDVRVLKDVVGRVRGLVTRTHSGDVPRGVAGTPDVYVIRTPAGGIPSLAEEAGTGSGQHNDEPGEADCPFYQLVDDAGTWRLERAGADDSEITVSNLSGSVVPANSWALAVKDKFGKWWAIPTAVGATRHGRFARLTSSSTSGGSWNPARWKYYAQTLNGSGQWADDGSESADYTAVPAKLDGTAYCDPVAGAWVWMWDSEQAGFQEFMVVLSDPLLVEVTAVSSGSHTVKKKTYSSGIADVSGPVTITGVRSATGTDIAVGRVCYLWKLQGVAGEYWLFPADMQEYGGEVTVSAGSNSHTVKRKTYSGGVTDYSPSVTWTQCRTLTGTDLAVGTKVSVNPIPDVTGNYWIRPDSGLPALVSGEEVLSSAFTFDNSGNWETISDGDNLDVTLPSVGSYLVWAEVNGYVQGADTGQQVKIECRLYNEQTAAVVPDTTFDVTESPGGTTGDGVSYGAHTTTVQKVITTASTNVVIRVEGVSTASASEVAQVTRAKVSYLKLSVQ